MMPFALLLCFASTALAAPIRIQSTTSLRITTVQNDAHIDIYADLTDDSGTAVSGAPVDAVVNEQLVLNGVTSDEGRVVWRLGSAAWDGLADPKWNHLKISAHFSGNRLLGSAVSTQTFSVDRNRVTISAVVSPAYAAEGEVPRVLIAAKHSSGPLVDSPIVINAGDYTSTVRTGLDGRATLRGMPAFEPGKYTVTIKYPGNIRYAPSTVHRNLVVHSEAVFAVDKVDLRPSHHTVSVAGTLADDRGRAITGHFNVSIDSRKIARGIAVDGRFVVDLDFHEEAVRFGARQATLSLSYDSPFPWLRSATSPGISLEILPPSRVSKIWYVLPLGFVIFVLGASLGPTLVGRFRSAAKSLLPPLHLVPESARARQQMTRTVTSVGSSATVQVRFQSRLVPSSSVACSARVTYPDGAVDHMDCARGEALSLQVGPQKTVLEVFASGFAPYTASIDNNTEGSITLELVPYRSEVRRVFVRLMSDLIPSWSFGYDTARDALASWRRLHPTLDHPALPLWFERLYYSGDHQLTPECRDELLEYISRLQKESAV
jgi:hypothetical protein